MHPIEHLRYVARASGAPPEMLVNESAAALRGFVREPAALVTATRRLVARHRSAGPLWNLCAHLLCSAEPLTACDEYLQSIDDDETVAHLAGEWRLTRNMAWVGWSPTLAAALSEQPNQNVWVSDTFGEGTALASALQRHGLEVEVFDPSGLGEMCRSVDVVLIESEAISAHSALCAAGTLAAAATAKAVGTEVWVTASAGRAVSTQTLDAMKRRVETNSEVLETGPWSGTIDEVPLELVDHIVGPDGVVSAHGFLRVDGPTAPELFVADIT